ncbi:MAG: hypothetical protein ACJAZM_001284 [Cyclobacteriaceae bacterium]|jgi:hypothetical protein
MKLEVIAIATLLALSACGGGNKTTSEMTAEEEAVVLDSITTVIDNVKSEVKTETDQAIEEINELLTDI